MDDLTARFPGSEGAGTARKTFQRKKVNIILSVLLWNIDAIEFYF